MKLFSKTIDQIMEENSRQENGERNGNKGLLGKKAMKLVFFMLFFIISAH